MTSTITRPIARRPQAHPENVQTERIGFAVLPSGELPLVAVEVDTQRIPAPATYGTPTSPPCPPGYRGMHRMDDRLSRAALTAATGRVR